MKKVKYIFIFLELLILPAIGFSQDTMFVDTPQEASEWIFANLNPQQCDGKLIEKSMTDFSFTEEQVSGNYNQVHDFYSWLAMYEDVRNSASNQDPFNSVEYNLELLGEFISEENFDSEQQVLPFGLVLHRVNRILDSASFTILDNQINPGNDEESMYDQIMIKSAALLEPYGDSGYSEGIIRYNPNFISVGDEIENLTIQLDVGNGFEPFNEQESEISYDRFSDSIIARVLLMYQLEGNLVSEEIPFYLTPDLQEDANNIAQGLNFVDPFDDKMTYHGVEMDFRVGIIYGCGNEGKIRRPVIFVPPYRPKIQLRRLKKYYEQYNVRFFLNYLYSYGYDVIIIKEKPGNNSIQTAGRELWRYINNEINAKKKSNFPDEDWENTLIGYSMGGQVARYALMLGEKYHMEFGTETGSPHPHTKLFIPFDSPHHGANIPIGCQAVIYEMARTGNALAKLVKKSMIDEASKDMGLESIFSSPISSSGSTYTIYPQKASERTNLVSEFQNDFLHAYSSTTDQRRIFPSFSRNVAISMGSHFFDYSTYPNEGLNDGDLMFKQNVVLPDLLGIKWLRRELFSAEYISNAKAFKRNDIRTVLIIPIQIHRDYQTSFAEEWDNAQGGHKNDFFKRNPTGASWILRYTAVGLGQTLYKNDVSFMPLVSALAINPEIWKNNTLYYNPKVNNLFLQSGYNSNYFGYPNVGHPFSHFRVTPFEAVYADLDLYEHIKISEADGVPNWVGRSDTLRNFMLNEIEADIVQLQNKVIGKNNTVWDAGHIYKAWSTLR